MLFNSLTFVVFFVVVVTLYWSIGAWNARKNLLVVASYIFYGAWNPPFAALLFSTTAMDFWLGRQIGKAQDQRARKRWLIASVCMSRIDFIGIGAPKCGTTWLSAQLEAHPQIGFAPDKEVYYFADTIMMYYYNNAYAMNQYLASLGYIVLSVNYRSGIGYGLNFREALNYGASGASEFNDVMSPSTEVRIGLRPGIWTGSINSMTFTHRIIRYPSCAARYRAC